MRPEQRDVGYLLDMLQQARGVVKAVKGLTLDEYETNEDLRLAVERRIEIIGEAARRVSEKFREAHPEIPWRKIIAQRNVLIHEYGEVEDEIMWDVATISVPELVRLLEPLVSASVEEN
ncbi:MAG TPA: HepT-like ribonuclease domain-containing protein [bacterium]|nr:HepT-like ribonuclease domain-containing protein [bacterium]